VHPRRGVFSPKLELAHRHGWERALSVTIEPLDWAIKGCRGDFDFTLTFEQFFFSVIPFRCSLIFEFHAGFSPSVEFGRKLPVMPSATLNWAHL
jgi:hypothetical protein